MRCAPLFVVLVPFALALLTGCPPEDSSDDDTPPRVLGVEPSAPVVPVTATFRVTFSESLNDKTVAADPIAENLSVVLVPRFTPTGELLLTDAFLSDIDNPPLSESRQDDVVAIDVSLEDRASVIRLVPRAALRPNTAYVLLIGSEVRDDAGNPLVGPDGNKASFQWDFTTDGGPPTVLSTDIGASHVVVPNRRRISVTFNQPVVGVGNDTLHLDGAPAANVEAILMDETATTATLFLDELAGGCERLGSGGTYTLVASSGIRALNGQTLEDYAETFTVSAACDAVPNILSGLTSTAADVTATVRFSTSKPATTEVRYGVDGGELDCLGGPCPLLGAPTVTANGLHTVTITGLAVNVGYDFAVTSEDEVGFVATASGTFATAPLPKIAVNEALADTVAGFDDAAGEFVELASFEPTNAVDLTGWKLRITKTDGTGTPGVCALPSPAPSIPAGGFLVLADTSFDPTIYNGVDPLVLLTFAGFCGLQNEGLLIELLDPGDRAVSSMTSPAPRTGRSLERTSPDAPDAADSFCFSRSDTGPTPGRENGVAQRGCE